MSGTTSVLIKQFENGSQGKVNTLGWAILPFRQFTTTYWPLTSGAASPELISKTLNVVDLGDGSTWVVKIAGGQYELTLPSEVVISTEKPAVVISEPWSMK